MWRIFHLYLARSLGLKTKMASGEQKEAIERALAYENGVTLMSEQPLPNGGQAGAESPPQSGIR